MFVHKFDNGILPSIDNKKYNLSHSSCFIVPTTSGSPNVLKVFSVAGMSCGSDPEVRKSNLNGIFGMVKKIG
tara:strand:+ start:161 stop:376 length:216 start_codon:yes stop_codon:yes gene_type:complete